MIQTQGMNYPKPASPAQSSTIAADRKKVSKLSPIWPNLFL